MTILYKNNQSGRSMIEMLGVLAIIGVLSVGGIAGYSKAMYKYKLTKVQDQITMLLMNIRSAYASSKNYDGLCESTVKEYNLAPNEMLSTTTTGGGNGEEESATTSVNLRSAFDGNVYIGATTISSTSSIAHATANAASTADGRYFYITMAGLGTEACGSLASSDWGTEGLVGIKINDNASVAPSRLPINFGNTGCTNEGKTNKITWVYY